VGGRVSPGFEMEEELRVSEQADRQKQIAAMEAAAPVAPVLTSTEPAQLAAGSETIEGDVVETTVHETASVEPVVETIPQPTYEVVDGVRTPIPIATSGELHIMPPSTGLPTPQQSSGPRNSALRSLLDAIPPVPKETTEAATAPEIPAHGN
jgi:sec-independent protein translocase protein TatB